MGDPNKPLAWLPFAIAEATLESPTGTSDADLFAAWSQLLSRLNDAARAVEAEPASRNRIDTAAGIRHLLGPTSEPALELAVRHDA